MKAIVILIVLLAGAAAVLAAQPVHPAVGLVPPAASDPVWMVLSGAALLSLASALRRYVP
jgi:hypothetical protein